MIILGSITKTKKISNGSFQCPNCYGTRYELCEVNKHFTLFLIPLFVLRKIKDTLCCELCNKTFAPKTILPLRKYKPIISSESLKEVGGLGKRILAFIIDLILTVILSVIIQKYLNFLNYNPLSEYKFYSGSQGNFKFILTYSFVWLIYGISFDSFSKGQTIGKKIFDLKVADINGNKMNFRNIIARNLIKSLLVYIGLILHLVILIIGHIVKSRRKTIHDIIGNTNVFENTKI